MADCFRDVEEEPEESPQETWEDLLTRITGIDPRDCPFCGQGKMIPKETLPVYPIVVAARKFLYAGRAP